jgi:hypothetical protein
MLLLLPLGLGAFSALMLSDSRPLRAIAAYQGVSLVAKFFTAGRRSIRKGTWRLERANNATLIKEPKLLTPNPNSKPAL